MYELKVTFHVNFLEDSRFQKFNVSVKSKIRKGGDENNINDVMSFQLNRLMNVIEKSDIEIYSATIQGDYLEEENIIKIEINEGTSKITSDIRAKKHIKTRLIIPDISYTRQTINKFLYENICKIYCFFMNTIKNKKMMSEILEIDETEDDDILFMAFAEQYGDLWFDINRKKELLERLKERGLSVIKQYNDK